MRLHLPKNRFLLRALLLVAAGCLSGFFVYYPIADGDIFWHLAAGRELFLHKKFLFTDPFSYTTPYAPWVDLHWFFQLCCFGLERIGGLQLLLAVKALLVGGAVCLLATTTALTRRTGGAVLLFLVALFSCRYLVALRPTVVTLFFVAATLHLLERYRTSASWQSLIALVILQVLWVNIQGLFLLGPALVLAFGAGELMNILATKRSPAQFCYTTPLSLRQCVSLFLFGLFLVVISGVNPYGFSAHRFAYNLFARINPSSVNLYAQAITENMPLLHMVGGPYMRYVLLFSGTALVVAITTLSALRWLRFSYLLITLGGMLLGWMAQRNLVLFVFMAFPMVLWNLQMGAVPKLPLQPIVRRMLVFIVLLMLLRYTLLHAALLKQCPGVLAPFTEPTESVTLLQARCVPGRIFGADRYGGYLLWKLFPPEQVAIDTRLTMRSQQFFEEYLGLLDHPDRFNQYAARWQITQVVLPLAPLSRYLPLAAALYHDSAWQLTFTDGAEILFVAKSVGAEKPVDLTDTAVIAALQTKLEERWGSSPTLLAESRFYCHRFLTFVGHHDAASRFAPPLRTTLTLK